MRYIRKMHYPQKLTEAVNHNENSFDSMASDVKKQIKDCLLKDQGGLCAYCMRKINADSMQIEHYFPQHPQDPSLQKKADSLSMQYSNMLAVCNGNKSQAHRHRLEALTCDQHKGEQLITVDPQNEAMMLNHIKYGTDGRIYSDDAEIDRDLNEVLNLNSDEAHMKENRKRALESLKAWIGREYAGKTLSRADWRQIYEKKLHAMSAEGNYRFDYLGILESYVRRKMS